MAGTIPEKHSSRTDFIRPGVILGTEPVADLREDINFSFGVLVLLVL
jgi:hypothetical protein